jgi:hypothetical protein
MTHIKTARPQRIRVSAKGAGPARLLTIWWPLVAGGTRRDRARLALMAAGAALATFFVLAAATVIAVPGGYSGRYFALVDEPGLRGGTALALALLVLPPIAFCYQASRLATATRDRRLAALRLAGATPRQVRILGALDTTLAAAAGSVAGVVAHLLVQLAGRRTMPPDALFFPFDVTLPPYALAGAALLVTAGGAITGMRAGAHVVASPLQVTRRAATRPPRALGAAALLPAGLILALVPWALYLLGGASPAVVEGAMMVAAFGSGGLLLLGIVTSSSWLVWRWARFAGDRARDARTLLAARMLAARPRAWGRALAVVGLVVTIGTGSGWTQWGALTRRPGEMFFVISYALVDLALLLAIAVAAAAIAVHQAEALFEGRRAFAALSAIGAAPGQLRRTLVREARLAALPVCVTAALVGSLGGAPMLVSPALPGVLFVLARAAVLVALAVGVCMAVATASGPLARRVSTPAELRYE